MSLRSAILRQRPPAGEDSRAGVSRRSTRERRCPWLTISIPAGSDHCPLPAPFWNHGPATLSSSAPSHEPADGAKGSGVPLASLERTLSAPETGTGGSYGWMGRQAMAYKLARYMNFDLDSEPSGELLSRAGVFFRAGDGRRADSSVRKTNAERRTNKRTDQEGRTERPKAYFWWIESVFASHGSYL
jgi:hypothetical protein